MRGRSPLIFRSCTPKLRSDLHQLNQGTSRTMDPRYQGGVASGAATAAAIDEGLRAYMLKVYNYMAVGLVLTGAVAFAVINVPAISELFYTKIQVAGGTYTQLKMLGWIALFAPLLFVWVFASRLHTHGPEHGANAVLGLCRPDGLGVRAHRRRLHLDERRQGLLHDRRHLRRDEPLRLHDQARPDEMGLVPDDGPDRRHHRDGRQHLPRRARRCISRFPSSACSSSSA